MCCLTPPGTSHGTGRRCRPSRLVPAQSSRSSATDRCSMCQSSGCSAMPFSKTRGQRLGHRPRPSPGGCPRPGPGSPRGCGCPSRRRRTRAMAGSSAAPVCTASSGGPAGTMRGRAEELDLDAALGEVAVGGQADHAALAQPRGQRAERCARRRRSAAAPPCRGPRGRRTKRWNSDSGLSRSATVVNGCPTPHEPGAGLVPVAHVRQREHHAAARGQVVVASCSAPVTWMRRTISLGGASPAAGTTLMQVAEVGAHAGLAQLAELVAAGGPARSTRRRLASSRRTDLPPPAPQPVGDEPERPRRSAARAAAGPRSSRHANPAATTRSATDGLSLIASRSRPCLT